ncbi:hypothetical protein NDQ53_00770 [Rossellomorea marisflavi]|nr:hypothetical protein [Rossellomorea marisflavi]
MWSWVFLLFDYRHSKPRNVIITSVHAIKVKESVNQNVLMAVFSSLLIFFMIVTRFKQNMY